jgi:hypothetical protein
MKELRERVDELAERFGLNPLHMYGGVALLAALLLAVGIGLVTGGGSSSPDARPNVPLVAIAPAAAPTGLPPNLAAVAPPSSAPVTTAIHPVTIAAAAAAAAAPAQARSVAAPQVTTIAPSAAANVTSLLPGQPAPPGIKSGLASYQIQASPEGAPSGTPWVEIGTMVVSAPTTSFSTTPPSGLMMPSEGQIRDVQRFWFQVSADGDQVVTLRLSGNATVTAELTVDGQADPMLTAKLEGGSFYSPAAPVTQVAAVGLAAGWHRAQLTMTRTLIRGVEYKAAAEIYMRGPNDQAPMALIPAAVPVAPLGAAALKGATQ